MYLYFIFVYVAISGKNLALEMSHAENDTKLSKNHAVDDKQIEGKGKSKKNMIELEPRRSKRFKLE